jgi:H+/Cl- antiporter ClcA
LTALAALAQPPTHEVFQNLTHLDRLTALVRWIGIGAVVGILCGTSSAIFLYVLEWATAFRNGHEFIIYTLPVAGLGIGWFFERFGRPIESGNNLIIDTIHDDGPEIPTRMAPMVLIGSVLTHFFGGSAGREGVAVQMGASLADGLSHRLRLTPEVRKQILAAGVAGGFGSVFGTPIAGAIFGMEFITLGSMVYGALVPALVASVIGDMTTRALGIHHTVFPTPVHLELTPLLLLKWLLFAIAMAATSIAFIELTHRIKKLFEEYSVRLPVRMFVGGILLIALWKLVGTSDYLGLGVPGIVRAFHDPHLPMVAFAAKLVFTAVTLGTGYLGGEVTPLFFIGASLGNVMARLLGVPGAMGAGIGMAAVFAASANTPLALSIMAMELLGAPMFPHVVIVCVLAYLLSGHRSIYPSQRVIHSKSGSRLKSPTSLRELHRK